MDAPSAAPALDDSLPQIIRKVPKHCLRPDNLRSFGWLARDILVGVVFLWILVALKDTAFAWWLGPIAGLGLGLAAGGLFVIGHDCGHRSFSKSLKVNNFIGHLTTSFVLWPFHVWRLDHDAHHRHTNHIDKDTAWRPVTFQLWNRMPKLSQRIYLWTRQKWFFLGSIYTTYTNFKEGWKAKESKKFSEEEKQQVLFSVYLTIVLGSTWFLAAVIYGGWYGFFCMWLLPQLVFHAELSTFTFFHHTRPERHFMHKRNWKPELAQLYGSNHIRYPWLIETMNHDINWHVPHHVCVGIPHYHLREAHGALAKAYPEAVDERHFGLKLIREVTGSCHFVASKAPPDMSWLPFGKAQAAHLAKRQANQKKNRPGNKDQREQKDQAAPPSQNLSPNPAPVAGRP